MSHFTKIKTKIINKECLIEALQNLDFVVKENVAIIGYRGRKSKGDVVIKTNKAYDVGFVKETDGTYQMVADWYGAARAVQRSQHQFLSDVQKEYATVRVINEVKRKGYRVQSRRVTETGEIKLLVVKRGYIR